MLEFKDENRLAIRKLVDQITTISIGNQNPNAFCFSTCFALSIHLQGQGIETSIVGGKRKYIDHFWLKLNGYDNIIIDATLKQFDEDNSQTESVYIGNINDNEITKHYKQEFIGFYQWIEVYHIWSNPNIDRNGNPRPNDIVEKIVVNNLIAASILNFEIENLNSDFKQSIIKSHLYKLYFRAIANMFKLNSATGNNITTLTKSKVGDKFDLLYLKVG